MTAMIPGQSGEQNHTGTMISTSQPTINVRW